MTREQVERAMNEGRSLLYGVPARIAVYLWAERAVRGEDE